MKIPLPILFALGTAVCWGLYGPVLGNARSPEKLWTPFKPYVGIGLAYIVWAFIGGLVVMRFNGIDKFSFSGKHADALTWGFAAGTLGALGALSLTAAMVSFAGRPRPESVMPVVFGGAVTLTALVSVVQTAGTGRKVNPWLWIGIVIVAVGVVLVASNTPHGGPAHNPGSPTDTPPEEHASIAEPRE